MSFALKIYDKTLGGNQRFVRELTLVSERMTVRQVIEARLDAEIATMKAQAADVARAGESTLVMPAFVETTLNGPRSYGPARRHDIDRAAQVEVVVKAFRENKLLMFVDNRQVTELDQEIGFGANSTVTFIRLVPLVGG